ncbi:MAG TPA: S8 family serine peptidase [bacterium]
MFATIPAISDTGRFVIPDSLMGKIGSGHLEEQIIDRLRGLSRPTVGRVSSPDDIWVAIYVDFFPDMLQIGLLKNLIDNFNLDSWTPPMRNHKFGYFLARIPTSKILSTLALKFIKRMETAEKSYFPHNNNAYRAVLADQVWLKGFTGAGVKIAVLDSGLDSDPAYSDLPGSIEKKDYSAYPSLDDDVENKITGHGTHVTATALGRGLLSAANTGNGGGPYKGMAPSADLVFLKIGNDVTGSASSLAIEGAMTAAVSTYHADIITMSYGGWDTYHDGSDLLDQKVDWCYEQGVSVFISAGNEGNDGTHFSGTVDAYGESGYIQINVTGANGTSHKLKFNLVWYDGLDTDHNELELKYYDASHTLLTDTSSSVPKESLRGTESALSSYIPYLPADSSTYYLKVFNHSSAAKTYHLYEDDGYGKVKFNSPDPNYTISSPASSDNAFAVGAFTSRSNWKIYNTSDTTWTNGYSINTISPFSSRGPRVDGVQKPDLTAPGASVISLRDRDVLTTPGNRCISNNGNLGDIANYYVMQGTSMACPVVAGSAALLLQKDPFMTPGQVYQTLREYARQDYYTGTCPNSTWGYGKLNIDSAFASSVFVQTKIFLETPYVASGDSMNCALRLQNYIPTLSPYSEDPRTVTSVPSHVVDWVLVQLRSQEDGAAVASKSAFLRRDGKIVSDDGSTERIILDAGSGNYYVVIKHRNHLAVMSSGKLALASGSSTFFDFTTGPENFYGTNGVKQLESNTYGMITGDPNGNGYINATDYLFIKAKIGSTGYYQVDINLNGFVNATDYLYVKSNIGKHTQVP